MLSNKIKFIAFLLILSILSCSTDKSQQESTSTAKAKIQEVAEFTPGSGNWLSFRGESASGVADGQNLPDHWNGDSLLNILGGETFRDFRHQQSGECFVSTWLVWRRRCFGRSLCAPLAAILLEETHR
jgi:hypothetical protein